ncbi:hypothetical protein [Sporosarcina sp. P34]|uniref:hypothetical protein n=1 Tax=Sporosarcina sp. P34 TaxID=2048247 RepID=UPI00130450E3|nr:hypothetical protein [Sporosarcina sp. P34]
MLNLAINLFLFIAILFMVGFMFLFFWVVTVFVFAVKEVKKEYSINVRSGERGENGN